MNGPQATRNADGKLCVLKEEMVQSVVKEPILKCTLKNVEKCHYTYITQFTPIREEVNIELVSKECNYMAIILHVYAGSLIFTGPPRFFSIRN